MLFNAIIAFILLLVSPSTGNAAPSSPHPDAVKPGDTIVVAIPKDLPPTYFRDKTGNAAGFAVDVMNELARLSGHNVEYIYGKPWDNLLEMVRTGEADMIPSLTISPERMELVAFTEPIEVVPVNLIVTADSRVTGLAPGLKVGILKSSIPEQFLKKNAPTVEILPFDDMQKVLFELLAGHIDAAFVLTPNLMMIAYEAGVDNKIKVISPPVFEAKRGMALRKNDVALRDSFNQAITNFVGSPDYAKVYAKWYGKHKPFWTIKLVTVAMGLLLLLVTGALIFWRYVAVVRLNKRLIITADALQATFDSVNDAIFIHDLNTGAILDVNKKMCDMYGYSHDEALQVSVGQLSSGDPPYTQEDAANWMRKAVQAGPQLFEWHARRKDGSLFWVEVNMRLAIIGGERRIILTVRDITGRKRAEEMLRKSEEFNRSILESVGEGFIVIDRDYRIISANLAYCRQEHISEVVGKHCYTCSHHIDKPCYEVGEECAPKHTFETGETHKALHVHHDQEGNPVYVEIHSYPLKDESGAVSSVIEVIEDITGRKKLEEQLLQAQKMEAVGQLAGGVAHDFNNILTAIMGHAYMLQMKIGADDPLKKDLDQILASANRAANLTQSLLAFSRKQVLNPKPMDLNETVQQVERFLHRLIGEDISFDIKLAPEALSVMADHGQIEQVLMNLATNARDAMPKGGLLRIETGRVVLSEEFMTGNEDGRPGNYSLVTVSDTGMGMDEKTRNKIFDPFFTTKEVGKGTGLGLAIVYGIIKQHGGFINVYSEPRKGTTFNIYLPLIAASVEKAQPEELIAPARGSEMVLLAEDDEAARILSKLVLDQSGYHVIVARDGAEAVEKFIENRDRVKLVILDVIMPKKNAREVYDEIRKLAPEIKTLFMSGYTADIIHKQGILDESVNFLFKPTSPTALLKKVREVLDT